MSLSGSPFTVNVISIFRVIVFTTFLSAPFLSFSQESPFPNEGKPKHPGVSHPLLEQFDSLQKVGESGAAIESLNELIDKYYDSVSNEISDLTAIVALLRKTYIRNSTNFDSALRTINQSLNLYREKNIEDKVILAYILKERSSILIELDQVEAAANSIDSAMISYTSAAFQDETIFKTICQQKYSAYFNLPNKMDSAIKYLDIVQSIYTSHADRIDGLTALHLDQVYYDFGDIYSRLGDTQKAISYHYEAIRRMEERGDIEHPKYADFLFSLAIDNYFAEEFDKSLFYGKKLAKHLRDRLPPNDFGLINPYNAMAVSYNELNMPDSGLFWLEKCKAIVQQYDNEQDVYSYMLLNIGASHTIMGNYEESGRNLKEALRIRQAIHGKIHPQNIDFYRYLMERHREFGEQKIALQYLDSAMRCTFPQITTSVLKKPEINVENITFDALDIINLYMFQLLLAYEEDPSNGAYLVAILDYMEIVENILRKKRDGFEEYQSVIYNTGKYKNAYEASVIAALELFAKQGGKKYLDMAAHYITSSKATVLLSERGEFDLLRNKQIPDSLKSTFLTSRKALDKLDNQLNRIMQVSLDNDSIQLLNSQKMKWRNELTEARQLLKTAYWQKEASFDEAQDLSELRNTHKIQAGKALIEFFVGSENIVALGVSDTEATLKSIPIDSTFTNTLDRFLSGMTGVPDERLGVSDYTETAFYLYNQLLAETMETLDSGIKELVIVTDAFLNPVPFELLVKSTEQKSDFSQLDYMVKDYNISYAFSSKLDRKKVEKTKEKGMLGFGYVGEGITDERASLGGLPGAEREIRYLQKNFAGKFYTGDRGTKQNFLSMAENYDVIHLALHGKADVQNRHNSALVFNGDNDYNFNSLDLYGLDLKSKMVVLSACESGLGKIESGEGTFSIARAFSLAGVPSVVTTLWNVNDQAGAQIVEGFYEILRQGLNKDEALRNAKLSFLENSDNITSHPYYWGSFVVMGDTAPIELEAASGNTTYWILGFLFATSFLITFAARRRKRR